MSLEQGSQSQETAENAESKSLPLVLAEFARKLKEAAESCKDREWALANVDSILFTVFEPVPVPISIAMAQGCTQEQYLQLIQMQIEAARTLAENGITPICPQRGDPYDPEKYRTRSDKDLVWYRPYPSDTPEIIQSHSNSVHSLIVPGLIDKQNGDKVLSKAIARRSVLDRR